VPGQRAARKHRPVDPLQRMEDIVGQSLVSQRVTAVTLTTFSVVASLLALLGLYGVLTHYVTERTHEIGVRIALGAAAGRVVTHVLQRSALMVVPGLIAGVPRVARRHQAACRPPTR
jgi:putative ABC transport system permease protein